MASNSKKKIIPVLAAFFVMGFCDIVGISSDYMQTSFGWSSTMTGFVPSMVFIWFLFLGIPIGNKMNQWGRKNTVLLSMAVTIAGMFLPLVIYSSATCIVAYILLGIGNAILQISLNPLLGNVITDQRMLTSSLTAGQVIKAISSLVGPEIVLFATLLSKQDDRCIFGSFSLNKDFGFTLFSDEHSGMCFSFVITHVYRWTRNIEFDLYWRCRTFFSICFLHNLFIVFSRVSY